MMLKSLGLSLLLFISSIGLAQTTEDHLALADRLADYGRLSMDWKIDSLLDFIDPELFEVVPRETLRASFEEVMHDENMRIRFEDFTVTEIGETIKNEGSEYVPIRYDITLRMKMLSEEYREVDFMEVMGEMLGGQTRIDPKKHTIWAEHSKMMFAIRHKNDLPWYFIEYQPENTALFDLLVPPSVREKLRM